MSLVSKKKEEEERGSPNLTISEYTPWNFSLVIKIMTIEPLHANTSLL